MSYKRIVLLDCTDFTDELRELFDEYTRQNEFYQDTLIHFYYEDYLTIPNSEEENEYDSSMIEVMKKLYETYPELIGEDLYIHFWW